MSILYYDCTGGISGDMHLGAMLDLGVPEEYLRTQLAGLDVHGYSLSVRKEKRKGIEGTKADVRVEDEHASEGSHHSRHFTDIEKLIVSSTIPEKAKSLSIAMFKKLGEAEAKVHGASLEEVHFHEVGAVDSIVDIVGAALCIDYLKPEKILSSPVELGGGFVTFSHGTFPVPAPATAELVRGIPITTGRILFEATTPTGAAIISTLTDEFVNGISFTIERIGYGAGTKDTETPNLLRVFQCASPGGKDAETSREIMVECTIDDMNPEIYDYLFAKLFEAGALDVFLTPVIMKKTRPGLVLSVLCPSAGVSAVKDCIFSHTTSIGLRAYEIEKISLARDTSILSTPYGDVRIKHSYYRGKRVRSKPEYEDLKKMAEVSGKSIGEILEEVEDMRREDERTQ